ncbi:MAG: hypothetical protein SW833_08055 [Cyanobacteriota bacterium]|nr:hypothetical protein [Cyanobacteriota bacterium]
MPLTKPKSGVSRTMCELNEQLQKFALEAKRYRRGDVRRRKALHQLIVRLQGKLDRPRVPDRLRSSYQEIYDTACQQIFQDICTAEIERYDPDKLEVLAWVNYLLHKRFSRAIEEIAGKLKKEKTTGAKYNPTISMNLQQLEQLQGSAENPLYNPQTAEEVREFFSFIEADPGDKLKAIYVTGNPQANLQFLALKFRQGYNWREISEELGVAQSTLSNFFWKNWRRFWSQS